MTSIEWLVQELKKFYEEPWKYDKQEIIEQAKEMHKAEHKKTWDSALDAGQNRAWNVMRAYCDFDEYYNETFKKD